MQDKLRTYKLASAEQLSTERGRECPLCLAKVLIVESHYLWQDWPGAHTAWSVERDGKKQAKTPKSVPHTTRRKMGPVLHQLPWGRDLETNKNGAFQFQLYLFFKLYHFMCMDVLPECTSVHHTCTRYPWCQKKAADPLEREWQVAVNCHVSAGNRTQVFWKRGKHS